MGDSYKETRDHIKLVAYYLNGAANEFLERAEMHDLSKLREPERSCSSKKSVYNRK